jgi:hypothetical protein
VGTRATFPTTLSNGTDTGANSFLQHFLPVKTTEVRLAYMNAYGAAETPGTDTISVRVGLGLPDGTIRPVFFRGSRSMAVEPGGVVLSDPILVDQPAYVVSRTYVTVSAGARWPMGVPDNLRRATEGAEKGTGITDKTLSGTIANAGSTGVLSYGPVAVIGRPAGGLWTRVPQIGAVGDSILWGQGDGLGDAPIAGRGFFERAINNAHGFIALGAPTETIAQFVTASAHGIRMSLLQGMSSVLAQHGCNDVAGGASFATMQSRLVAYWAILAASGARIWQTTLTPKSTSTDGWTTVVNQTTDSTNSARVLVNNWIRDGGPMLGGAAVATGSSAPGTLRAGEVGHPLTGYVEIADTVESARDSGLWRPDPGMRTVTDAVMTSGSDLLGSVTAGFSSTDVTAWRARVTGAGAAGTVLTSTIRAYPGGTNVNLSNTAGTTVSGGTASIYRPVTSDGVHPDSLAAVSMAAAVPVATFASIPVA